MGRMAEFFSFRGRVGRQEYWLTVIATWVLTFAAGTLLPAIGDIGLVLAIPLYVLVVWATLAMLVRRLHDRGRSGWWLVLMMGPVAVLGALAELVSIAEPEAGQGLRLFTLPFYLWVLIDLGCLAGKPDVNRFGPPIRRPQAVAEAFD